ncbi:unnamed protein product [Trichobilharzia regenti]|nr:unnamed protein product [Trichobilharzia regenti]
MICPKLCASSSSSRSSSQEETISLRRLPKDKSFNLLYGARIPELEHKHQHQQQQQQQKKQQCNSPRQLPHCHKEEGGVSSGYPLTLLTTNPVASTSSCNLRKELLMNGANLPVVCNKDISWHRPLQNTNSGPSTRVNLNKHSDGSSIMPTTKTTIAPPALVPALKCSNHFSSVKDTVEPLATPSTQNMKNAAQSLENDIDEETMTGDRDIGEHVLSNRRLWEDTNLTNTTNMNSGASATINTNTITDNHCKPTSSSLLSNLDNRTLNQSKLLSVSPRSLSTVSSTKMNESSVNNNNNKSSSSTIGNATRKHSKPSDEINPRTMCNRLCFKAKRIHDALESGKFVKSNHGPIMHNSCNSSDNMLQSQEKLSNSHSK